MKKTTQKRLDWALDKLNDVALGAYALGTGDKWIAMFGGVIATPDTAKLLAWTLALFAVWAVIGWFKGDLADD